MLPRTSEGTQRLYQIMITLVYDLDSITLQLCTFRTYGHPHLASRSFIHRLTPSKTEAKAHTEFRSDRNSVWIPHTSNIITTASRIELLWVSQAPTVIIWQHFDSQNSCRIARLRSRIPRIHTFVSTNSTLILYTTHAFLWRQRLLRHLISYETARRKRSNVPYYSDQDIEDISWRWNFLMCLGIIHRTDIPQRAPRKLRPRNWSHPHRLLIQVSRSSWLFPHRRQQEAQESLHSISGNQYPPLRLHSTCRFWARQFLR